MRQSVLLISIILTTAGSQNEKKLYELIWKRTIASQMADAEVEKTSISIDMSNSPVIFQANGEVVKFDGFLRVYAESTDQENGDEERYVIPPVKEGNATGKRKCNCNTEVHHTSSQIY